MALRLKKSGFSGSGLAPLENPSFEKDKLRGDIPNILPLNTMHKNNAEDVYLSTSRKQQIVGGTFSKLKILYILPELTT